MNRAHWIVAGLMAAVCLTGSSRMFVPKAKPAATGGTATRRVLDGSSTGPRQVDDFSPGALKTIGAVELLASAGLIPPAALGVAPVLVPPAATGLVLPLHASRAEHPGRREPISPILTVTRRSGTP